MELHRARNTEIEQTFYRATKATFGPDAFVGTHDTTFPYPDAREFERNGLDWWTATRDYAQSDEITPYSCRTSMAKKFGGPVWYNQWYMSTADSYGKLIWSYALAGGRMNFHILYPSSPPYGERGKDLRAQTCRLIDGTVILASGEHDVLGDPIQKTLKVRGRDATFDAVGIAAVRMDQNGRVEAMAAGGLKSFKAGDMSIELAQRADVAVWRDANGAWQGRLQGHDGPVPEVLLTITKNWTRLRVPARMGVGNPYPSH